MDLAVNEAQSAFNGEWASYTGAQRARCLNKMADLLDQHAEEIGYFESICSGRPLAMAVGEVPLVAATFRCKITQAFSIELC